MNVRTYSDSGTVTAIANPYHTQFTFGISIVEPIVYDFYSKDDAEEFLKTLPQDWLANMIVNQ